MFQQLNMVARVVTLCSKYQGVAAECHPARLMYKTTKFNLIQRHCINPSVFYLSILGRF